MNSPSWRARAIGLLAAAFFWGCEGNPVAPGPDSPVPLSPFNIKPRLSGPTGDYLVTLTASPVCDRVLDRDSGQREPFPAAVQLQRYRGSFADGTGTLTRVEAPEGAAPDVRLGGIDHYFYEGQPLMYVTTRILTIIVPPKSSLRECAGGDYWWVRLGEGAHEFCGVWRGFMYDPARIEGTIEGVFAYYDRIENGLPPRQICHASDHQFTMIRR
jgi:hypothetical protein